ncbi:MAG: hypothetical protein IJS14_15495 [Lentisphaeria bacterium]|nr:hypothetical protein [Lentisphaeria bacterium]
MSMDFHYSYDFRKEVGLNSLTLESVRQGNSLFRSEVDCQAGDHILLYPDNVTLLELNGSAVPEQSRSLYYGDRCGRFGVPVRLQDGKNELILKIKGETEPEKLKFALVRALDAAVPPEPLDQDFDSAPEEPACPPRCGIADAEWIPGAGHRTASPGRFGFTKGDGLLDCAVCRFGLIDKMYLCGHPAYDKPYRWGYCVLPGDEFAGASREEIKNDKIRINQLSVIWESQGVRMQYSLASPGIITECESRDMKLSQLEFAGGYRYMMTASRIVTPEKFRPEYLTENWLLLFGSQDFPEVPLVVVLDRRPEKVSVTREKGRLSSLTFHGCRRMITATPFGFESLQPKGPSDTDFLRTAARKCRFWSRAFMAFPIDCKEYFHLDHPGRKCHIKQEFTYRRLTDEWNTEALELAPIPPVAALSSVAEYPAEPFDPGFPTKFGPLLLYAGDSSAYTLPMMPYELAIPLRNRDSEAASVLKDGLEDFYRFQAGFPENGCSYAYIGSNLERYGFTAMMFHFLPEEYRRKTASLLEGSVKRCCDPETVFSCNIAPYSLLHRLEKHSRKLVAEIYEKNDYRMDMKLYYLRREPFTGAEYAVNYLNQYQLYEIQPLSEEGIARYPEAYIENDWGLGISFYLLYISALWSGCFEPIRKHWESLCRMWDYLDIYHDWACMASGYSENGNIWTEGANYGIYHAFINLAEIAGDRKRRDYAIYMAAQQLALRLALYRSSQCYFHKFFGKPSYGISKAFREEQAPTQQFQGYPQGDLDRRGLRLRQLHSFMTEGAFPELLRHCGQFLPEEHRRIMRGYLEQSLDPETPATRTDWSRQLTPTMALLDLAADRSVPEDWLRGKIDEAVRLDEIIGEYRDIGTYATYQPKNLYYSMILAELEARRQPLRLSHWEDLRILDAVWEDGKAKIRYQCTGPHPVLRCRVDKTPDSVSQPFRIEDRFLTSDPDPSGYLEIGFNDNQTRKDKI